MEGYMDPEDDIVEKAYMDTDMEYDEEAEPVHNTLENAEGPGEEETEAVVVGSHSSHSGVEEKGFNPPSYLEAAMSSHSGHIESSSVDPYSSYGSTTGPSHSSVTPVVVSHSDHSGVKEGSSSPVPVAAAVSSHSGHIESSAVNPYSSYGSATGPSPGSNVTSHSKGVSPLIQVCKTAIKEIESNFDENFKSIEELLTTIPKLSINAKNNHHEGTEFLNKLQKMLKKSELNITQITDLTLWYAKLMEAEGIRKADDLVKILKALFMSLEPLITTMLVQIQKEKTITPSLCDIAKRLLGCAKQYVTLGQKHFPKSGWSITNPMNKPLFTNTTKQLSSTAELLNKLMNKAIGKYDTIRVPTDSTLLENCKELAETIFKAGETSDIPNLLSEIERCEKLRTTKVQKFVSNIASDVGKSIQEALSDKVLVQYLDVIGHPLIRELTVNVNASNDVLLLLGWEIPPPTAATNGLYVRIKGIINNKVRSLIRRLLESCIGKLHSYDVQQWLPELISDTADLVAVKKSFTLKEDWISKIQTVEDEIESLLKSEYLPVLELKLEDVHNSLRTCIGFKMIFDKVNMASRSTDFYTEMVSYINNYISYIAKVIITELEKIGKVTPNTRCSVYANKKDDIDKVARLFERAELEQSAEINKKCTLLASNIQEVVVRSVNHAKGNKTTSKMKEKLEELQKLSNSMEWNLDTDFEEAYKAEEERSKKVNEYIQNNTGNNNLGKDSTCFNAALKEDLLKQYASEIATKGVKVSMEALEKSWKRGVAGKVKEIVAFITSWSEFTKDLPVTDTVTFINSKVTNREEAIRTHVEMLTKNLNSKPSVEDFDNIDEILSFFPKEDKVESSD